MKRLAAGLVAVCAVLAAVPVAGAASPRASLTDIEQQVMCVTCGVPLAIAESPQAEREREYIRGLIARGEDTAQIKRELVGQYGPNVLALPRSGGFNLAVYLVPVALVLALFAALALALPRWRRRGAEAARPAGEPLSEVEAQRLESDLARYEQ